MRRFAVTFVLWFKPRLAAVWPLIDDILGRERDRLFLWLPVCLGLGIAVYFSLLAEPPWWLGAAALIVAASLGYACRQSSLPLAFCLAIGAFALGFSAAQWRTAEAAAPVLTKRLGPVSVSGRLTLVETFQNGGRVTLERLRITGLSPELTPEKVRFRLRGAQPVIYPGDWISLQGVLSPPSPPAMPGAFDFQRQAYFEGLGGVGFAFGPVKLMARTPGNGLHGAWLSLEKSRQEVTAAVINEVGGDKGALAAALMTGIRSAISKETLDSMRDSGLFHLLSISGLHIGLAAGVLFFAVRGMLALFSPLALRYPIKKWAAFFAILGAFAYSMFSGATVPTQRSFLMIFIVLLAVLLDRRGLSMRNIAWSAGIILIIQPETLLGASFQMSFAAVTALIAAYEVILRRRLEGKSPQPSWWKIPLNYIWGIALTTLIAGAATTPFSIYHFNQFQAYGIAANLIAIPVTALLIMPCLVAAFALMPLGLQNLALTPMAFGAEAIIQVANDVSSWPGASGFLPLMPSWGIGATAFGLLWLCLWQSRQRLFGAPLMAAGMFSIFLTAPPDILVNGQGELLAVRTIDGGLAMSSRQTAKFESDIWRRRAGLDKALAPWPRSGFEYDGRLSCDFMGCIYRANGYVAALVQDAAALQEDCLVADIVVSSAPVRLACLSALLVIDRFDLFNQGGHALWLQDNGIRVESVNGVRGDRPWVIRPRIKQISPGVEADEEEPMETDE